MKTSEPGRGVLPESTSGGQTQGLFALYLNIWPELMYDCHVQAAPDINPPTNREAHLWVIPLDAGVNSLGDCLSPEELSRMSHLRGARRRRFCVTHTAIREVLSAYTDTPPQAVALSTPYGAPPTLRGLQLGLSYCDDLAVLAVSSSSPVGVDVEPETAAEDTDLAELAFATLTDEELETFTRLDPAAKPSWWLRAWVRKEAALKARGEGISDRVPSEVDVSSSHMDGFALRDLDLKPRHLCSVAAHPVVRTWNVRGWPS
jgi:4'-phosphopantetheinyl transferase